MNQFETDLINRFLEAYSKVCYHEAAEGADYGKEYKASLEAYRICFIRSMELVLHGISPSDVINKNNGLISFESIKRIGIIQLCGKESIK